MKKRSPKHRVHERDRKGGALQESVALVACSSLKSSSLVGGLRALGASVIEFPTILIRPVKNKRTLDAIADRIAAYQWIIFTSSHGVLYFLQRMDERAISLPSHPHVRTCAVGPASARTLTEAGIEVALVPERYSAEGIVDALEAFHGGLSALEGQRILLPRAKVAREILPRRLRAAGAEVDMVVCYESALADVDRALVARVLHTRPDLIVFTSSSTVSNFVRLLGEADATTVLRGSVVAVIGPITAATVESAGLTPSIVPAASTIESLLESIAAYYR